MILNITSSLTFVPLQLVKHISSPPLTFPRHFPGNLADSSKSAMNKVIRQPVWVLLNQMKDVKT